MSVDENNKAKEPFMSYGKRLVINDSLQDQENDNYLYWLSISPEERLAGVTHLMLELYKEELKIKGDNRIYYDPV